ncbi:MAG: extracellular solute-binding protein [Candidatus Poseidoniales archaeon]|nr:MAG: extracellular solute-binding protein [Candidatus Poseidoniales archaeon]
MTQYRPKSRATGWMAMVLVTTLLLSGCLGSGSSSTDAPASGQDGPLTLEVWHTFAAESKEENVFLQSIKSFEEQHPNITVEVALVPFGDADQLFMTAAQGGEAPDLMRLSSDQLGAIGEVRVDGFPLLEDLRPHLTPSERGLYDERALYAMRYGDALYGVPASQDALSLVYNKALFDARGVDYPDESWTQHDLLEAAERLTHQDVQGLALPVKSAYWWFGFQAGYNGSLFDASGAPTLDSNGSAEALDWLLDLELEHGVVATGTQTEGMKNQFIGSKAAMIVDGPWNWATYEASRLDIGQAMLPVIAETGERVAPLVTYKGWTVSKQSANKLAAVELAQHLSSVEVQKDFALETYTLPTHVDLADDVDITNDEVLSGFLAQIDSGTPAPTTRAMAMVYGPLVTAFEQVYTETSTSDEALQGANAELISLIEGLQRAEEPPTNEGYRTVEVNFTTDGSANYRIVVDGVMHSLITVDTNGTSSMLPYDSCQADGIEMQGTSSTRTLPLTATRVVCTLTGMVPNVEHEVVIEGDEGAVFSATLSTGVGDVVPTTGNTSPVLFALGAIFLSLFILLSYGRAMDVRAGRLHAKSAHVYIAPAMFALALLTFYPVLYGFWLSFTDADATRLGEEAFVGLANFIEVFSASGFLRVTLFTLVWTLVNVSAHIGLGLFLAMVLQSGAVRGTTAYRTVLLLPWAIPSYISVLVWKGMFQPEGLVNDVLGTNLHFLADPTGAQFVVIFVNIWLGVPFMMMSLSGALQALPSDMYEAAKLDGVGAWDTFRHLTLPNLKSALVPLSLLGFIWTFNMFNVIYLLTDGGPDLYFGQPGQTDILITYVYDVAFRDGAYGVAAAWSVIIFLMLLAFSWSYMKRTNATEATV